MILKQKRLEQRKKKTIYYSTRLLSFSFCYVSLELVTILEIKCKLDLILVPCLSAFTEFDNSKLTTRTTCEKLRQIAKVKANLLGN